MPRRPGQLPQLAAAGLPDRDRRPSCFPDSPLVLASLDSAMTAMWGRAWNTPQDPGSVPPASTKPKKWVEDFRRRFYASQETQVFPVLSPKPSSEENGLLRRGSKPSIAVEEVSSIESLSRHALSSLGTVDWLFGTLRHVSQATTLHYSLNTQGLQLQEPFVMQLSGMLRR